MNTNFENLFEANKKLGLEGNVKPLIFVYCSPKVGSTSLVSSLNLYALSSYVIFHIHGENMLKVLYGISGIHINDIIEYNAKLRSVYVIDIFREPIEQKISMFFEDIITHFNTNEENVDKIPLEKLFKRFNHILPHLSTHTDYFKNLYGIEMPEKFDFETRYMIVEKGNIKYIKLRLRDADSHWSQILKNILSLSDIKIVKDYTSDSKIFKETFIAFKREYKLPSMLFDDLITTNQEALFYLSEQEQQEYFQLWREKSSLEFVLPYLKEEYQLYLNICYENKTVHDCIQQNHYIDSGCNCRFCNKCRNIIISDNSNSTKPFSINHANIQHVPYPVPIYKHPKKHILRGIKF